MPITPFSDEFPKLPDRASKLDVISVSSLNKLARSLLESNFPAVLVEGEVSNLATPASGHWYFTLKDERSQIRCAMFRNKNMKVRFKPENGMQIITRGRLSLYEGRGEYQLIVDDIEEAGDGALRRAFEQLKAKLSNEGLFDSASKQAVTSNYRHVGVITSATGAAIRDILSVFARRFPSTRITVIPVIVQGKEAAADIARAIESANQLAKNLDLDVLIIGRGGGSLEDLQAFNEEQVARAIFASSLPVVSAVGHEIDFTIADFVADLRAPTPSAAAELLSPDQEEYQQLFRGYTQQLLTIIQQKVSSIGQQVTWLLKQLKHPGRRLLEHAQTLDLLEQRLSRALKHRTQHKSDKLSDLTRALRNSSPQLQINRLSTARKNQELRLIQAVKHSLKDSNDYLIQLSRSLNAVSPLNTLGRGYSITYDENNEVLSTSDDVKIGSQLTTRLSQGQILSAVVEIKSRKKH